jgi:hypothetical protein
MSMVGGVGLSFETGGPVFEQLLLPLLEADRLDAVFVAEIGHGDLLEEVLPDDRYFCFRR